MTQLKEAPNIHDRAVWRLRQIIGPYGPVQMSKSQLYALMAKGKFPKPLKCGRMSFWLREDVLAFIDAMERADG